MKGVGSEKTIQSLITILTEGDGDNIKVKKVEDKWDGSIEEGPIKKALRGINATSVPAMVSVPKSVEEEESQK